MADLKREMCSHSDDTWRGQCVLTNLVLSRVQGGIWHTTSRDRFQSIIASGAILPEPPIDDRERWSTSQGPRSYPYVRRLGGVSLFDFSAFNPETYSERLPGSSWQEFVPCCSKWKEAVWIEIDAVVLGDGFISGRALLDRWRAESCNQIMPEIEAAHIGPIPVNAFRSAFAVHENRAELEPILW